jgi:hypothetical protein
MTMQWPALEARKLTLPLVVLLASAACKNSDKDATVPSPSAEASASSEATSADTAAPAAAAAEADQPEVGDTGDEYDDADPSALSDFHGALDPHGSWADDGKYGTVWVPSAKVVGSDFVPYRTGGHWVYGDDYTWVSDYDWGWAPFHYGRWVSIDGRGWGWIPGRKYAPAWVSWRVGAPGFAYVGWSPAVPEWGWRGGAVARFGFAVEPRFSYCGTVDLFAPRLEGRVVVGPRVAEAEAGTRVWSEGAQRGGRVAGPPPARCGIAADRVPHPPAHDPGLERAKGFGKPATAVALGAHPPSRTAATVHSTVTPGHEHETVAPGHETVAPGHETVAPGHETVTPSRERPSEPTLANHSGGGLSDKPAVRPEPVVHGEDHGGGNKGGKPPEPKHH